MLGCFFVGVFLSSCSYQAYRQYYSDLKEYKNIWELPGIRINDDIPPIFPQNIDGLNIVSFHCRYDEQIPLGEGIQLLLEIEYFDQASFDMEKNRLESFYSCSEYFSKKSLDAFANSMGTDYQWEYALVDTRCRKIYYVYIQNLPESEVEFEDTFLPDAYSEFNVLPLPIN